MKTFWIRVFCVTAIAVMLLGYNSVLAVRDRDEQIAKLEAEAESAARQEQSESNSGGYADGTYSARLRASEARWRSMYR